MEEQLKNTRWEPLWGGAKVLVSREHGFGTDAVLLAHFSRPKPGEVWADLGTGCGVIPLLWRARASGGKITGVEAAKQCQMPIATFRYRAAAYEKEALS